MLAKLRIIGVHLLILTAVAGGAAGASLSLARVAVPWRLPHFPALPPRMPQAGQESPIGLAQDGLPPDAAANHVSRPRERIHAIVVAPHEITLLSGGRVTRSIWSPQRSPNLPQLVQAIADPSWISAPVPGVVVLRAALIMKRRTTLTVAPPAAHLLLLVDRPGVFLGAHHGTLRIRSAAIESPRLAYTGSYRPFVLAEAGSRLLITHSLLAGLGWNADDSYGVSWKTGSTGGATGSTFADNYFGVYTGGVSGVRFTRNLVTGNYSYGFDPHSYSSRLLIMRNTVTGNGRHGIILADHVTDSLIAGNVVRGNAANGIMMYQASTGNVINGNTVAGNHGDGIVVAASPRNRVIGNVVRGNRVGLHLTGTPARTVQLSGNVVSGNVMNAQGIPTLAGNTVASDVRLGWDADWLAIIWVLGTVLVTVTLMSLTHCLLGD